VRRVLAPFAVSVALGCTEARITIDSELAFDGSAADGAASADSGGIPACGAPPYVTLDVTVLGGHADGTASPLAGAVFTSPLCPGASATSDASGHLVARVTAGAPFYARFVAPGYAMTLSPEETYTADAPAVSFTLLPSLVTTVIPGYSSTEPVVFLAVANDTATGACAALDGVTFEVEDHPEAVVTYYSTDPVPQPTTGTATTARGLASIQGLPAQAPVTITATKPGCTLLLARPPDTGRAPLEAGYITEMPAYLEGG
jgi:hypothetical protein